jgi:hemolysin III
VLGPWVDCRDRAQAGRSGCAHSKIFIIAYHLFTVRKSVVEKIPHLETSAEEMASSLTHAIGGLLAIAALSVLVVVAAMAHDSRRVVSVSVYGGSLVLMYGASTCYHFARPRRIKRMLKILDHASIYLLIAGTYTPILLISMRGSWGWSMFGVIWGLAVAGVILKLFFVDKYEPISVGLYVAMGWLVLVGAKPLFASVPGAGIVWLFAGGISYTSGVIFFLWDSLPFNHAIWHLFVIAGSVFHFLAVWFYVLPVLH